MKGSHIIYEETHAKKRLGRNYLVILIHTQKNILDLCYELCGCAEEVLFGKSKKFSFLKIIL
jgi:hypothetical protein